MVRGILPISIGADISKLANEAEIKALKEGKKWNLSGLLRTPIKEALEKYIKEHGDGNPGFDLEQWIDNPEFIVTPALFRDADAVRKYLESVYGTKEWDKIGVQLQEVWINQFNDVEASHI